VTRPAKKALIWALEPLKAKKLAQTLLDQGWEVISVEDEGQELNLPSSQTIDSSEASQMIRNLNCPAFGLIAIELFDFRELLRETADYWSGVQKINPDAIFGLLQAVREHHAVTVVCDSSFYEKISRSIQHADEVLPNLREDLAAQSLHKLAENIWAMVAFLNLNNRQAQESLRRQGKLPLSISVKSQ